MVHFYTSLVPKTAERLAIVKNSSHTSLLRWEIPPIIVFWIAPSPESMRSHPARAGEAIVCPAGWSFLIERGGTHLPDVVVR
jgi:hypothetical protein